MRRLLGIGLLLIMAPIPGQCETYAKDDSCYGCETYHEDETCYGCETYNNGPPSCEKYPCTKWEHEAIQHFKDCQHPSAIYRFIKGCPL